MKVYKLILVAILCLTNVKCKLTFSSEDKITTEPPITVCPDIDDIRPATSLLPCISDFERTPLKMSYVHGGWFGPSPNYRLSIELERDYDKVYAKVDTPNCKMNGTVSINDYIELSELTSDVEVQFLDARIIDAGNEYMDIFDSDAEERLFLRVSDLSYKKPIVRDESKAQAIRSQVNKIADKVLSNCIDGSSVVSAHLRENIQPITFAVDPEALRPHSKYKITIQDLRIEHLKFGTRIYGYRTIVGPTQNCQTKIDSTITNDSNWRAATAAIKIVHSEAMCSTVMGASDEDWRIVFPNNPKQLHTKLANGTADMGFFGCQYGDRVQNAKELEVLLNAALKKAKTVCEYTNTTY
jgi:hypothetical protein